MTFLSYSTRPRARREKQQQMCDSGGGIVNLGEWTEVLYKAIIPSLNHSVLPVFTLQSRPVLCEGLKRKGKERMGKDWKGRNRIEKEKKGMERIG